MSVETRSYPELAEFERRMRTEGLAPPVIEAFGRLYRRYRDGDPGKLSWGGVSPPGPADLVGYERLEADRARGEALLGQLVVVSLNGGLGTTMRLERAKSLIPVRGQLSFLDLKARQVLDLRRRRSVAVPWLLMNSFHTRGDSLRALEAYPDLAQEGLPLDFLQNKVPRIVKATALPAAMPDPEDDWAPPGHGDVYLALELTGLLEALIARGIRWAFVSNVDNLGATVDPSILGFIERQGIDFAMEVTERTLADIKGGPLIRFAEPPRPSRLMLLERTQVENEHVPEYDNLDVFNVFNTNSLWWRVEAVREALRSGSLEMPMIVNPKTVEGVDLVQLETAMGAAVGCFERAVGIRVPRSRFAPVKATVDLLAVRSDAYVLDEAFGIRPSPERPAKLGPPLVKLDDRYYKALEDLDARFPEPPSLVSCRSLTLEGDIRFGRGVRLEGDVTLRNRSGEQHLVPDGTVLRDVTREL